jgi:hypothetical protein
MVIEGLWKNLTLSSATVGYMTLKQRKKKKKYLNRFLKIYIRFTEMLGVGGLVPAWAWRDGFQSPSPY